MAAKRRFQRYYRIQANQDRMNAQRRRRRQIRRRRCTILEVAMEMAVSPAQVISLQSSALTKLRAAAHMPVEELYELSLRRWLAEAELMEADGLVVEPREIRVLCEKMRASIWRRSVVDSAPTEESIGYWEASWSVADLHQHHQHPNGSGRPPKA